MRNVGGRPPARFCKWGHDTDEVGRDAHGQCKQCRRIRDRRRDPERRKKQKERYIPGPAPLRPEWERDRVSRWVEIVRDDPIPEVRGAAGRMKEFETRYKRLEADVPSWDTEQPGARV